MLSYNQWESEFFSRKIYSLDVDKWDSLVFRDQVERLGPELVEARVALECSSIIAELAVEGFVIADTTMDFIKQVDSRAASDICTYEAAETEHITELKQIAKESIIYSRFDNSFFGPNARERIYMEWVANAVTGEFDDLCLISRIEDEIAGFVTCRKDDESCCRLGLLAVKNKFQGRGVGAGLIVAAECFAINESCDVFKVSTQYSNRSAIRFYSKVGFMINTISLWFYRF